MRIGSQLGVAKELDCFRRVGGLADQLSVLQHRLTPHLIVRVESAKKKVRWVAGSCFLDLLLTFIRKNRKLTRRARKRRCHGLISGDACIDAPQVGAPSEQRVGHAPESLIENRTCSNSLMGISIFNVNPVRPAFSRHIPGESGFSILNSRSKGLGENDSLFSRARFSLRGLRLPKVGLIGSLQSGFDRLPIFGGNCVAEFSLEHLTVHGTRSIMLQRPQHMTRTFYMEIMAMVCEDESGRDDHDSRDRIAHFIRMFPHGHQTTITIQFLVEFWPSYSDIRKYEALPYLFCTGVRNLNCNLSDAPNLAKAM